MIGLLRAIHAYEPDRRVPFPAFADLCIERSIVTALRRANRNKDRPLNESIALLEESSRDWYAAPTESLIATSLDPADEVVSSGSLRELKALLARTLTALEWDTLRLCIQGYSYPEIAALTRSHQKAVDNALQRGRQKVRAAISEPRACADV